jgi:hypothetical protein
MQSSQVLTINYPTLCHILDEEDAKDPERDYGNLDIMRENFKKNTLEILQ